MKLPPSEAASRARQTFTVPGDPVPQGSKRVFRGRVVDMSGARLTKWKADIHSAAKATHPKPIEGPVEVMVTFHMRRPKAHYGSGRNQTKLKATAPRHPELRPDIDKLLRAVLDGLTGAAFVDDQQVCAIVASKEFALGGSGITVTVAPRGYAYTVLA